MSAVDLGLFLLRLGLAALLTGHSVQKSLGWLRGMGPARTAETFESWGFRPGWAMVRIAATCELVGALSLATGLLMRLGCAVVLGTMIVAASPNARNGLWAHLGGCEVPVTYGGIAACLAITGPGRISIDHAAGLPDGGGWGAALAIALGALAAVPPLLNRRRALRVDA